MKLPQNVPVSFSRILKVSQQVSLHEQAFLLPTFIEEAVHLLSVE